jgi:hypothetical protein
MKASEVRIGNLLNHNNGFVVGPFTVNSIHISDLERDNAYAKEYEPIPLTEEWLIEFGFKKENNTIYSISDKLSSSEVGRWYFFKNENNSFTPHIKRENKFSWIGKEIKHVHQLQNLYFALTGEELGLQNV